MPPSTVSFSVLLFTLYIPSVGRLIVPPFENTFFHIDIVPVKLPNKIFLCDFSPSLKYGLNTKNKLEIAETGYAHNIKGWGIRYYYLTVSYINRY